MSKSLFMETTKIEAHVTAGQICSLLVSVGASQVNTEYANRELVGMRWVMPVAPGKSACFAMPAKVEPIYKILQARHRSYDRHKYQQSDREQAKRVAWRQILRWCEAQVALIQTGMVDAAQPFSPYVTAANGRSLWENILESGSNGLLMLEAGPPS